MEFSSINIQGNIVSSEVLEKIRNEDIKYQQPPDFGLDRKTSVRDEIGVAWAAARAHYTAFKMRIERLKDGDSGASETRNSWMIPLLREMGYDVEKANAYIHPDTQKTYAISHKAANLGGFPIHIMGVHDDLDRRRESSGPRLSPHALVQEYLNNTNHTYALVTNGRYLRLLRDATRLVRLSYLEVDLQKMMEEELYADFAILFRLLHASRMPKEPDAAEESYIEYYHQESLASGSRIREKLSGAVEESVKLLANGFLHHPANSELRQKVQSGQLTGADYYLQQLRLIYRFLFLVVTEERNLVYPETRDEALLKKKKIYYEWYSIERLRRLAGKVHYIDGRKHDLWEGMKSTFLIFEQGRHGEKLGIKPLGSGLFAPDALGKLKEQKLDNKTLLTVLHKLTYFENSQQQQTRVNYGDLDVEEFGSVYEGLLEYDAKINDVNGMPVFAFVKGTGRSSSGSHYTPEELVKPLIKHSLDYLIADKLKETDPEAALLSLRVADVACGSGHILLSAARRIAFELACIRETKATGGRDKVEQPSPTFVRQALRLVIRHCIYGVDKNPLAVELCKVALWLESHNPGEPLGFLDHHIKCGDAIVGLAHREELERGIPDEAFKALPGDEKEVASAFAKRNKQERAQQTQASLDFEAGLNEEVNAVIEKYKLFEKLPERTPEEISQKARAHATYEHSIERTRLKQLADAQVAQFFIPKTDANKPFILTDAEYRKLLRTVHKGMGPIQSRQLAYAEENTARDRHFFHYFLEFPEVFSRGGFDCILGNPPFLGGKKISGNFGDDYLNFIKTNFEPSKGGLDFVVYFFRRIFDIVAKGGFFSLISTNTVAQGDSRISGLEYILSNGGLINFAVKSTKWPGLAAVDISIVSISKTSRSLQVLLNNRPSGFINSYLDEGASMVSPHLLEQSIGIGFIGSYVLGAGFILSADEKSELVARNIRNREVIFPLLVADDINNNPSSEPSRFIINFFDWPESKCKEDYPECYERIKALVLPERLKTNDKSYREKWWQYGRRAVDLYSAIKSLDKFLTVPLTTKYLSFVFKKGAIVVSHAAGVIASDQYYLFALLSNTFHEQWAWLQSSTMGGSTLRYTPSKAVGTFPFPRNYDKSQLEVLENIGRAYYETRQSLMLDIQYGFTDTYNYFHSDALATIPTADEVMEDKTFEKKYGKDAAQLYKHLAKTPGTCSFNEAVQGIIKLRELHVQMDNAVLEAYGWQDIIHNNYPPIENAHKEKSTRLHDFYEVDYLPENDRVRYTIHPAARKEVLKRLLELNHKIHEEEKAAGLWDKKSGKGVKEKKGKVEVKGLFD
jgi:type I restriction-modification system DNA methylase subunit